MTTCLIDAFNNKQDADIMLNGDNDQVSEQVM